MACVPESGRMRWGRRDGEEGRPEEMIGPATPTGMGRMPMKTEIQERRKRKKMATADSRGKMAEIASEREKEGLYRWVSKLPVGGVGKERPGGGREDE